MPIGLRRFLITVDFAMIVYWSVMGIACLGLITLPTAAMYDGYGTAQTDAWNWSFAPLDIAFSLAGLAAVRLADKKQQSWQNYAMISLVVTMSAGGMAIAYWALSGDFNAAWWIPNLFLLLAPLIWIPKLLGGTLIGTVK